MKPARDPEELMREFAAVTAIARAPRLRLTSGRPSTNLVTGLVGAAAVVLVVAVAVLGSRLPGPILPGPSPTAAAQSTAAADATTLPSPPAPSMTPAEPAESHFPEPTPLADANSINGWSPDGRFLVVQGESGFQVLDGSGVPQWGVRAWDVGWLDSDTLVANGSGVPGVDGPVRLYNTQGDETGALDGVFEGITVATGQNVLAVTHPVQSDELPHGATHSVWDGRTLSEVRPGRPLAWSQDATLLAVLLPNGAPSRPGFGGTVALVDRSGARVLELAGWQSSSVSRFEFSPDGKRLAGCMTRADENAFKRLVVVEVETGQVAEVGRECGYFAWSEEPALYSWGLGAPVRWTPEGGTSDVHGITEEYASTVPSAGGNLAYWSNGGTTLRLYIGRTEQEHELPGRILQADWRPDGSSLAVLSDGPNGLRLLTPAPPTQPPVVNLPGEWRTLPPSPIDDGRRTTSVWTGSEFIVWGAAGLADGAAYNPTTNTWRRLPDGPPGPASYMVAFWTGEVVIAWHGGIPDRPDEPDGGIYDPATDTWSRISPSPLDSDYGQGASWTGTELLVLTRDMRAAAYKPVTNSWRDLPSPPLPSGGVEADWTGNEWLVVGFGTNPDAGGATAAFEPLSSTWTVLAPSGLGSTNDTRRAVWTGDSWLWPYGLESIVYDRAADEWRADARGCGIDAVSAVVSGSLVVSRGGAYDLDTGICYQMPPPPSSAEGLGENPAFAWTGSEMLVWGGSSGTGDTTTTDGAAFRPSIPLQPEPEPSIANCTTLVMPDPLGELDTNLSVEEGLLEIVAYGTGGDSPARVQVEFLDPSCLQHPVLGRLIDHALAAALESPEDTLNCNSFRGLLASGTVGYQGQPIDPGTVDSYINRWCYSDDAGVEILCMIVWVVDQPLGDFPRTLSWQVFMSGRGGEFIDWAEITVAGANDGEPERLDYIAEEGFVLGLREFGPLTASSFLVKMRSGEVIDAMGEFRRALYEQTVNTGLEYGVPNGIYRRVFSTCPG